MILAAAMLLSLGSPSRGQGRATAPDFVAGSEAEREYLRERSQALAQTLLIWGNAFNNGRLSLQHNARLVPGNPVYGPAVGGKYGPLRPRDETTTHFSALQKLLFHAEGNPTVPVARAILPLASAGFERGLYDVESVQVRDLAHWALMRMESNAVWLFLQRVAAGEAVAWLQRDSEPETLDPASQVAAIRLLGSRNLGVFRPTVEQRLLASDARIRLAAAEALERMARARSLSVMLRALSGERHPVVAQALLNAIDRILRKHHDTAREEDRAAAATAALRLLGRAGWRADLTAVNLLEKHPVLPAIPALISVLERAKDPDKLVKAVNERATPLLRHRTWEVLCSLTGTILPAEEPEQWRDFWAREKDRIVLVDPSKRKKAAARTRATFYDIPVVGGEIAFLIDTSGSMKEPASRQTEGESQRRRRGRKARKSRLDAAVEQILGAVGAMDKTARYHLLTFDFDARVWNRKPVPPSAIGSLTQTLGRLKAEGGTNVHAALAEVLGAGQLEFGEASANSIEELFVLSDGQPTAGVKDPETILRLVRELNRYQKIRINTVFTGSGAGADFMRRLAQENDGVFVQR